MSLKVLATVIVATLLAGCQTMTPEERRAADEAKCSSYGFKRNTDAFAACLQRIDLDRSADMRARDAEGAAKAMALHLRRVNDYLESEYEKTRSAPRSAP